ncbi:MAG: anaerobic carbon-monoxide dehydrogenase catalytic subunit, partial [Deltaproteobacteria bacterium]|nr:anaerobic carbon-monoxide dehydrogenase catalytic subunit [Deltaproteobacteria bacterium]
VEELTPNPASRELLSRLGEDGTETAFDRFEAQQPQCGFGLRGTCCRMCQWGPCRIGPKSPRGICGRDQTSIVFANILRALVSGLAGHARHAHEVLLSVVAAAEGRLDVPLLGEERVRDLAARFRLPADLPLAEAARKVAGVLLEDLGRLTAEPLALLEAYAPEERKERWRELGILPRSASYEVLEALHMTTLGGCSDWRALAAQELRAALAYCYATLFGSSFATEILYGVPRPRPGRAGYGVLREDSVNLLLHGHSPVMAEQVLLAAEEPELQALAREAGAAEINVAGLCCTGDELLARHGIPTITNILGQELVLGTGAVDAVVADMQCVIPGIREVADCYGTRLVTTCDSNRIEGAVHVAFDPERPEGFEEDARRIVRLAIEAFRTRDRSRIRIPARSEPAVGGWSTEAILEAFGGRERLAELLRSGRLKGIATLVGCNNPKVPYEANHVTIARRLVAGDVLVTTTGCCSHALLNAGLCAPEAAAEAGPGLRGLCEEGGIPPVLAVGGCVDNARTLRLFFALSDALGVPLKDLPLLFVGGEPGNEKTVGQGATFLCHGISNLSGFPAPIPVAVPTAKEGATSNDEMSANRNDVVEFFGGEGLYDKVGAKIYTEPDPALAAQTAKMHFRRKRRALGWD